MTAYYNEIDPYCAAWLKNLIAAGLIAPGDVDTRSITEVTADDIRGYTQVHMFAGIATWSYALRQAGWADDRPVMTLSCPCQPFSSAGKRKGFDDARHLWPHAFRLIEVCRPGAVFGEQVSGKNGLTWLDVVQDDLEGCGYAVGALGISAAGVGAPHIRKRLYFVADSEWDGNRGCGPGATERAAAGMQGTNRQWERFRPDSGAGCASDAGGSYPYKPGRKGRRLQSRQRASERSVGPPGAAAGHCPDAACEQMGPAGQSRGEDAGPDAAVRRRESCARDARVCFADDGERTSPSVACYSGSPPDAFTGCGDSPLRGFWADAEWLPTIDGRYMPTQRGLQPLALSYPGRVEQLRAYGNSLCAETAIEFVKAYMECRP